MTEPDPTPDPAPDPTPDPADEQLEAAGLKALDAERKARKSAERRLQDADDRVQALQRAEIERIASHPVAGHKSLAEPSDLWKGDGVALTQMIDEHGSIDAAAVWATVDKLVEDRPHWATRPPGVAGSADARKGRGGGEASMDEVAARIIRGR
jgi:hypothetical protein